MIPNYERKLTSGFDNGDSVRYVTTGISCNVCHRVDGPAIIGSDGSMYWVVYGTFYRDTRKYCEDCGYTEEETVMMLLKYGDTLPHVNCGVSF